MTSASVEKFSLDFREERFEGAALCHCGALPTELRAPLFKDSAALLPYFFAISYLFFCALRHFLIKPNRLPDFPRVFGLRVVVDALQRAHRSAHVF